MKGIAVAGKSGYGHPTIGDGLLVGFAELVIGQQPVHVAVRAAVIIAAADLHHFDAEAVDVIQRGLEGLVVEEECKYADFHEEAPLTRVDARRQSSSPSR